MLSGLLCVLLLCIVQLGTSESKPWYVGDIKDPIYNYEACGRLQPSFVCDPDRILDVQMVDEIDNIVRNLYNDTRVECYGQGPHPSKRKGYLIMVAAVQDILKYSTQNMTESWRSWYMEARWFAYQLSTSQLWGKHSSGCSEVAIILYVENQKVLLTITQSNVRETLTDDIVLDFTWDVYIRYYPFTKKKNAEHAIMYLAQKFSEVLHESEG